MTEEQESTTYIGMPLVELDPKACEGKSFLEIMANPSIAMKHLTVYTIKKTDIGSTEEYKSISPPPNK